MIISRWGNSTLAFFYASIILIKIRTNDEFSQKKKTINFILQPAPFNACRKVLSIVLTVLKEVEGSLNK